ncbi:hypothetical protein CL673_03830 [Candidatus Bathyarchaeota archaeon]|nr:hypothetical protein [Candidatus Bathyarchaeota archaeon]
MYADHLRILKKCQETKKGCARIQLGFNVWTSHSLGLINGVPFESSIHIILGKMVLDFPLHALPVSRIYQKIIA